MNNDISNPQELKALGCKGVSEDSRDIEENYLFVALQGHNCHGLDFIDKAIDAGAKFIISDKPLSENIALPDDVILAVHDNARQLLPHLTAYFCGSIPSSIIGVTGTNGKTSCSLFTTQIFRNLKVRCSYGGTLGFDIGSMSTHKIFPTSPPHPDKIPPPLKSNLTSERPLVLHRSLNRAYRKGINYAIIEASSIGLEQHRLDALRFCAAAITSFGKDHILDHDSIENYKKQKMRLFDQLLEDDAPIVVGRDLNQWFVDTKKYKNLLRLGKDFSYNILSQNSKTTEVEVSLGEFSRKVLWQTMPKFQFDNLAIALSLVFSQGFDALDIIAASQFVKGIVGRFETVVNDELNRRVIVDYAHNEEALRVLLNDSKQMSHNQLHLVIGGGGNRDKSRRKGLGEVAKLFADKIYVTEDSPRNEPPEEIRKEIISFAGENAIEVPQREKAIHQAIGNLKENDILIIAGKGNENMEVMGEIIPWDDRSYAIKSWNELNPKQALPFYNDQVVSFEDLVKIIGKPAIKGDSVPHQINGISIDSRTIKNNDLFFALQGPNHDGHKYIDHALQKGASAIVCTDSQSVSAPCEKPVFVLPDSLKALWDLAEFSAKNKIAKIVGITGSVGKTSARQAINLVASQSFRTHATQGNLNNHFGMPLSLARSMFNTEVGILEVGIDRHEDMPPMAKILTPDIAVFTSFAPAHTEKLGDIKEVINAKLQLLEHMKKGSHVILPCESPYLENLKEYLLSILAPYKNKFSLRFIGKDERANDRILSSQQNGENLDVQLQIGAKNIDLTLHAIGDYWSYTALIALVVSDILGQDISYSSQGLRLFSVNKGRGNFVRTKKYSLLDHSYNASPLSMTAALESLASLKTYGGNRFAILGDMSELGENSLEYHRDILNLASTLPIDGVFLVGENFASATALNGDNLPREKFVVHKGSLKNLSSLLKTFLQPDDIVMIKGSRDQSLDALVSMLS